MKHKLVLLVLVLFPLLGFSQDEIRIKGTVTDSETNVPIPGVYVLENGTQNGVATDFDGNFSISVPQTATLKFSYLGYKDYEVEVSGLTLDQLANLQIALEPDAASLDEVVVVAYGKQNKVSVVGAVSTVRPDKLRTPATNISTALAGNIAGIIGVQRSGQPGADGANFYIRGISTYSGASGPLILLDGVEISSGDLNNLSPEIIESVSVLKDASATALYGNRGANGVLIITTKTGRNLEKPRIHVRMQNSVAFPTSTPDFVNGVEYMKLFNEAVTARGTGEVLYSQDKINGTAQNLNKYIYPNVDWYGELFKNAAMNQEANVNIQGGGKKVGYFMSATFNRQTGILKDFDVNSFKNNIEVKKFSFQNNIDAQLSPTTKIALKLNTQLRYYHGPASSVSSIYGNVMNTNPVAFPKFFPLDSIDDPRNIKYGGRDGGRFNDGYLNPFAQLTRGYADNFSSTVLATLTGEQDLKFITEGLKFRALVSFKNYSSTAVTRSRGYNQYQINSYRLLPDGPMTMI